ncbi:MAG: transaldolase [Synergistaceae bacterium]|nr:transaldolase [Synergistaceae bacterium]
MATSIHETFNLGQSIWLDYINKAMINGGLDEWIELGVTGVTTNPSIFENAIAKTSDYDDEIRSLAKAGKSSAEIYEVLTLQEVGAAADIMRPVYDKTNGKDGYVSLEVNPLLASDKDTTISEAKRLFALLNRPNVMIKIPATPEGVSALTECIAAGINVNSTLIFSKEQYISVAKAYIEGTKRGGKAASVASVFVSRVDTAVDKLLADKDSTLCGRIAVDGIKLIYQEFKKLFANEKLVQRPLWASTGTKNKSYSDVKYVEDLIGPDTVNTVPPATLEAFVNHGQAALTLESNLDAANEELKKLAALGIDINAVCAQLLDEGLKSFNKAFESLMAAIENKAKN